LGVLEKANPFPVFIGLFTGFRPTA
jgi:hypothetical protein